MTKKKPAGLSWDSFVERQFREAQKNGEFEHLPGYGKPLENLDKPWIKSWLANNNMTIEPPQVKLYNEVQAEKAEILQLDDENEVRDRVAILNEKIKKVNAKASFGPPSNVYVIDIDGFVERWRETRLT